MGLRDHQGMERADGRLVGRRCEARPAGAGCVAWIRNLVLRREARKRHARELESPARRGVRQIDCDARL
jgi:hypothetical protein